MSTADCSGQDFLREKVEYTDYRRTQVILLDEMLEEGGPQRAVFS